MTQAWPSPIEFGPWLLDERLGVGGTSEVWRARHEAMPGDFAVKRLLPVSRDDAAAAERFAHEISCMQRVCHPRLPPLVAHGDVAGILWLAMPAYSGATLRRLLALGPLPVDLTLALVAELADGLATLHAAGLVHCDVSPDNVQVTADGEVVLLDLGIAQEMGTPSAVVGRSVPGRAAYFSPEQQARQPLDGRSDLFAMGSMLTELLTGTAPFLRSTREQTLHAVHAGELPSLTGMPASVRRLVHELLAPKAEQRCPTAAELHRQATLLAGEPPCLRAELRARVAALPPLVAAATWQAAEMRGEIVTDPAMDDGATVART